MSHKDVTFVTFYHNKLIVMLFCIMFLKEAIFKLEHVENAVASISLKSRQCKKNYLCVSEII